MKKILSILCMALVVASCSKDVESQNDIIMAAGEGAVRFALAQGSSNFVDQDVAIKIYKENTESGEYELVRRYTNVDDVPDYLSLLEGQYKAVVQVGERKIVSFDTKYYYGEKYFTITHGAVEAVEVDCKLQSTIVKVQYDASIVEKFEAGYATTVAIDDEYNQAEINSGDVHSLKYTETKEGYFMMPEGQTTIVWHFEGVNPSEVDAEQPNGEVLTDGKIVANGKIENVKANSRYTVKLKYSKDAPGKLVIEATYEPEPETPIDNNISFSPDPTILGDGFDMINDVQSAVGEALTYKITALANVSAIELTTGGVEFDVLNTDVPGITRNKISDLEYTLTISDEFFVNVPGGVSEVKFHVEDVDGGKKSAVVKYANSGVLPITDADCNLWFGNATLKAMVYDTAATDVKIAYRKAGTDTWTEVAAAAGADNLYTATATGLSASEKYEVKLLFGSDNKGKMLTYTTISGTQLPNAGLENWHQSQLIYPYLESEDPFWLTGNNSFATLTQWDDNDVRPGSTGTKSAFLKSQLAGVMGITKFAAGNLFTGTFVISGTNGTVTFGRDFEFTAKPKSLTFWMKNNEGQIDAETGVQSGTDIYTIMILITDGTTYSVNTKDESTFLKLDKLSTLNGVIGYGYLSSSDSHAEWVEKTINITYREDMKDVTPRKIVVSFTPSGYGDYFCGSSESWMKVDDLRLNY